MAKPYITNVMNAMGDRTQSYLNKINYRDLLQVLTTEYLMAVSTARQNGDVERLEKLEDPAQFWIELLKKRMQKRDEEYVSIDEDLLAVSNEKMMAYNLSTETKWSKRPSSAYRPSTSGGGEIVRPNTAPPGGNHIVREMQSVRDLTQQVKVDYDAMKKRVEALEKKKKELEKLQDNQTTNTR